MEAQIAQLSPPDAAGFQRFLNENRVKLLQIESCLESPFLGWRDIFNARLTHVTISCRHGRMRPRDTDIWAWADLVTRRYPVQEWLRLGATASVDLEAVVPTALERKGFQKILLSKSDAIGLHRIIYEV